MTELRRPTELGEAISDQDTVLLGRKTYDDCSAFLPNADFEPFAPFIHNTPKYVVTQTLKTFEWRQSALLSGDLHNEVNALKSESGKTIGVHGSISLVESLLVAGLLDELRFILFPTILGNGRRLLTQEGSPIRLTLQSAKTTPSGLQSLVFRPRS